MSIRITTLASGSDGNAILAEFHDIRLLIDAGISGALLEKQLARLNVSLKDIAAILLTHEHIDHCRGLSVILKKQRIPVYTTRGTFEGMAKHAFFAGMPKESFHLVKAGESFAFGPLLIQTLPLSHDSLEPVAFRLNSDTFSFAVVTDLGSFDEELIQALQGLNALVLEANHDPRMLEAGPYPYPLKLRIAGGQGHLSNGDAARLLERIAHPGLKDVLLGHMSKTNNYPPLALATVTQALSDESMRIEIAPATELSPSIVWPST